MGVFWALAMLVFAFGEPLSPVSKLMVLVSFLGFLTCWAGFSFAWSALTHFRCPRCGKRFLLSWSSSWPTAACKHCGLYLG